MVQGLANAISGLRLNRLRVETVAQNIAASGARGFVPQDVSAKSIGGGAVEGRQVAREPAFIRTINESGQDVDIPNVSLDLELAQAIVAEGGYKANATIIRSQREQQRRLLDVLA